MISYDSANKAHRQMMRPNALKGNDRLGHYKSVLIGLTNWRTEENLSTAKATFGGRCTRELFWSYPWLLYLLDHFCAWHSQFRAFFPNALQITLIVVLIANLARCRSFLPLIPSFLPFVFPYSRPSLLSPCCHLLLVGLSWFSDFQRRLKSDGYALQLELPAKASWAFSVWYVQQLVTKS